jgi:hypothetical protein
VVRVGVRRAARDSLRASIEPSRIFLPEIQRAAAEAPSVILVVDVDSFVGEVHGYAKQGAAFGYTQRRGYHPILATRAGSGEVLHIRCARAGRTLPAARCGSSKN